MMMIISRALAILAACLLVGASAGFGVAYAWQAALPHGAILASIAVAMALGLEIAKPFAIHGVFTSLKGWHIGRALALLCVGLTALLFSLTAELTFQAMMRGDMTAERGAAVAHRDQAATARAALEAKAHRLEAALAALPTHRTGAVLEAAIAMTANGNPALWRSTRGCELATKPASATWCRPILALRAELATTQDAARIEGELDTVRASLATARANTSSDARSDIGGGLHTTIGVADPGASALAVYAAALGLQIAAHDIAPWLPLIGVIALEIGATFAGVLLAAVWAFTDHPVSRTPHTPALPVVATTPPPVPPAPMSPIPLHAVNAPVNANAPQTQAIAHTPVKALTYTPRALVQRWAGDCVGRDRRGAVTALEAYQGFTHWCQREGLPAIHNNAFYNAASPVLKAAGGRRARDGRRGVSYTGLKLLA